MNAEDRRVVRRGFNAAGHDRLAGEVVDVSTWRWTKDLEEQQMLVPMPLSLDHITCGCGRHWQDVTAMERHACTDVSVAPQTEMGQADIDDGRPAALSGDEDKPWEIVPRGGGWFDVRVAGEIINPHGLRRTAADALAANLEIGAAQSEGGTT